MADTPARPRFQFHLATLVVCVVLTGALLGWNMRPIRTHTQYDDVIHDYFRYGFPFDFFDSTVVTTYYNSLINSKRTFNVLAIPLNFAVVVLPVALLMERRFYTPLSETCHTVTGIKWGALCAMAIALAGLLALNLGEARVTRNRWSVSSSWIVHLCFLETRRGWPVDIPHLVQGDVWAGRLFIKNSDCETIVEPYPDKKLDYDGVQAFILSKIKPVYPLQEMLYNGIAALFIGLAVYVYSQGPLAWIGRQMSRWIKQR
jgi:hypothetical protein